MKDIGSNAYYEIPLEKEREEDQAEAEALSISGQCYCHLTMQGKASGHAARPCHVCEEEVRREWPEMFEEMFEQEPAEHIELAQLDIAELEKLQQAWEATERKPA